MAEKAKPEDVRMAVEHLTKKLRQAEARLRNSRLGVKKLLEIKREARRALSKCIEHKCLETPCRECSHYGMDCNSRRLLKLIDQHDRGEHLREAEAAGCGGDVDLAAERSAVLNGNETDGGVQ